MNTSHSLSFAPLALVLAALVPLVSLATACEDRMIPAEAPPPSSLDSMPRAPQPVASAATPESATTAESAVVDVGDAGPSFDDGRAHAIRITACAIDTRGCRAAQPSSPVPDSSYRVVLGRGVGMVRTRSQAMADLYKEIRDRTESGQHLEARPRHLGDSLTDPTTAAAPRSKARAGDEPLVEAAFQLMDAVDADGEVALDASSERGTRGCKLSLGALDPDGGATHCLLDTSGSSSSEPSRPRRGR